MTEATRRHAAMVAKWAELGHPAHACSGHTYPLPDCPAPGVHSQVFPPQQVVPKVTAFTETAVVYAVLQGDLARARELIGSMLPGEQVTFEEQLSTVIHMLWGER